MALRILNQSRVVGMMWELRIPGYISNYQQNKKYSLISSIELRQEAKHKLIVYYYDIIKNAHELLCIFYQ